MMEDLVPKPDAMKPPVWAYLGFVAGADGKTANKEKPVCKECGRTVATKGSNTSNLLSHFRNSHPTIYSRIMGNTGSAAAAKRLQPSRSGRQKQTLLGSSRHHANLFGGEAWVSATTALVPLDHIQSTFSVRLEMW